MTLISLEFTFFAINITQLVFLLACAIFNVVFFVQWRYLIRLENLTDDYVQLRERFWKVFSINGSLESVTGKGVVGVVSVPLSLC